MTVVTDPLRQLAEFYHCDRSQAVKRAIRAECPGGEDALNLLARLEQMQWSQAAGSPAQEIYERMLLIVDAMENDIRLRWGLQSAHEIESR